jgi:murein DD-endopeptidase MepM/ murein hydrolase activator NlpD
MGGNQDRQGSQGARGAAAGRLARGSGASRLPVRTSERLVVAPPPRQPMPEDAIGHEPPLDVSGQTRFENTRRGVNLRWLFGSVITAFTGAALLGAAIFIAIEGRSTEVSAPQRALAGFLPLEEPDIETANKGDKLVRSDYTVAARNTFRTPITTRVGDREVVSIRGFTRIATNLSLTAGQYATDIPRFDPMQLMSGDTVERVVDANERIEEAEVSFRRIPLNEASAGRGAPALSDREAAAQVMEQISLIREARSRPMAPLPAQTFLSRTIGGREPGFGDLAGFAPSRSDPFDAIDVRVIPENVTTVAKLRRRPPDMQMQEISIQVLPGEPFVEQLEAENVLRDQIEAAISVIGGEDAVTAMQPSLAARALLAPAERSSDPRRLLRIIFYGENGINAIVAIDDRGRFAEVPFGEDEEFQVADSGERGGGGSRGSGARLHESLYETAYKHGLSRNMVEELIQIFAYDVDLQRRVSLGDAIDLLMTEEEDGSPPELLSAALTVGGETRQVYRFVSPEDGTIEFFDPEGRSLRKFLMRKPVADGRMTSGFGMRRHPILGYARMHTGVDYGARTGTPIFAAGSGRVIEAGWSGGYGRRVEIQHANGYVTTYSHMNRIASGIEAGVEVTQGQVIGTVGSTGLSTGPHLHYEVLVNGDFVDPLKIRVPRSRELDGRELALFNQQRDEINELIERAGGPVRFAQVPGR